MTAPRRYRYVGPQELSRLARPAEVVDVESADVLDQWLSSRPRRERTQPLTYVITLDGMLRLAPRHSEQVACAAGADVLAAGEIQFALDESGWTVAMVSNQSTGYCPDLDSWPTVAAALDRLGVTHPKGFTHPIVFRACLSCGQINVVREGAHLRGVWRGPPRELEHRPGVALRRWAEARRVWLGPAVVPAKSTTGDRTDYWVVPAASRAAAKGRRSKMNRL